jgi:hypothetical protein
MEQKRSTRLILKTSDLTNGSTTNIGSCDTLRQNFTWFNINLRALLGDLYNQYDYFNLLLISVSSSHITAAANQGSADDRLVYVKISGLPFINQSYNQPTGNNITSSIMAIYSIPHTAVTGTQQYNNVSNVMTFGKSQDLCNINISLFRILDDTRPVLNARNINPQFTFIFTIIGIDKADNPDRKNYLMKIN